MSAIIAPRFKWMQRLAQESYSPSTDVPNLVNWYRADTVTIGTGVSQLTDKKGSVNLTQATGSKQPTQNVADSLMGGRDSITFDGVDDALIAASPGVGAMNAITIYLAIRSMGFGGSTKRLLSLGNGGDAKSIQLEVSSTGVLNAYYNNPASTASTHSMNLAVTDASAAAPRIFAFSGTTQNGGSTIWSTRARLGGPFGTDPTTSSTGSTIAVQAMGLGSTPGGSTNLAFTFAELMICDAAHTAEQMRRVELYLAGYYGLL